MSTAHLAHYLNVKTTVADTNGEAVFRLVSFRGQEEISRLFHFTLELLSPRDVRPEEIVGKPIAFSYQDSENKPRWFHGYVSGFSAGTAESGQRRYQADVVPWLWFLTRTADCRIFARKTVPQILKEVFDDVAPTIRHPVEFKLSADGYREWAYCVQYRESDFNFVSRLMEQEGIFYYFKHEEDKHTLVLCDRAANYDPAGAPPEVRYEYSFADEPKADSVTGWERRYQFIPASYVHTDYHFAQHPPYAEEHPNRALQSASPAKGRSKEVVKPDNAKEPNERKPYEIFDYPGEYETRDEGAAYGNIRMESQEAQFDVAQGTSFCQFLHAGSKFTLIEHPSSLENGTYVVVSIGHSAVDSAFDRGQGQTYQNSFSCIPANVVFRTPLVTPKPAIQGAQTAVVVGPPGKEIHTDPHGRVQVQFFWDRRGSRLQEAQEEPVWIRVGQIIAGKNWGAMFIPRVGQEVIVTFLEGDPDRPIITGVVYNNEQKPPYDPTKHATRSYIKTSSSPGGEGFNEIRFEDRKDHEQIFIHAQRNLDTRVRANCLERVFGNHHQITGWEKDGEKGGDHYDMVYQDRHVTVHRNHFEHVGGDMQLTVGGIEGEGNQQIVVKKDKKELIEADSLLHVKGERRENIEGHQSLTVGGDQQETVGNKYAVDAGQEIHLKAGTKVVIESGGQLTIKGIGGFVDIGPNGVTIEGLTVNLNCGGSAGNGSGSSPAEPEDAEEAKPEKPKPAANDRSGQKSTPFD